MMQFKKALLILLCIIFCFGCSCRKMSAADGSYSSSGVIGDMPEGSETQDVSAQQSTDSPQIGETQKAQEKRAVWISFLEYMQILKGKTESQFKNNIAKMFDNCVSFGLNTVIVQVRGHEDAYYKSNLFPASFHFTGKRQNTFPFDPLAVMVSEAHQRSLKIEAWVNPYRGNKKTEEFAQNDPVKKWLGTEKVFSDDEYFYLNPGEPEVKKLVLNGVAEIVENYDVDGIHFDDYFYPNANESYDTATYKKYGAGRTLKKFRTDSINEMISSVYKEIKKRKNISFGISPAGNIESCTDIYCSDVRLWCKEKGYIDYIAPQLYWDYGEGDLPYEKALGEWKSIIRNSDIKLVAGLAAYKAGDAQFAPFWSSGNVLSREVTDARKLTNYGGFALFRYDFFFNDTLISERKSLKGILQ